MSMIAGDRVLYSFKPSGIISASFLLLFACQDGSAPAPGARDVWSGTIDTLASGRLLIRNPDVALWRAGEAWQLRERFRLGTLEGDGPDLFGDIRDVELGRGGELYVLESQAAEIRVFGPDGAHLRTFGRPGQGPGELSRPAGMALGSDGTLWIMNWGNARYSGFDPNTGELITERRRLASFTMIPWPGRFDPSDRLLDIGLGSDGQPVILGLDTAFIPQDTLMLPQADERHRILFRRGDLLVMSVLDPFAPQPSWAPHPHGGIVVGEGDAYRLHRVDFSGDTTVTIEVIREPIPVSPAERDSALAEFREIGQREGGATPNRQPRVLANKPAHGAIMVDDQGRIWVRRTPVLGAEPGWDVIAHDGRLLGPVMITVLPSYAAISVRGDQVAVVTSLEGVPTVVVYDLVRPARAT